MFSDMPLGTLIFLGALFGLVIIYYFKDRNKGGGSGGSGTS